MNFLLIYVARAITINNPLGPQNQTVADIIRSVVGAFQILAGGVATVMVLWGAFKILTAGGEPKKFEEGKHTIIYAAVGLAIVFLAGGVVSLVADLLGSAGIGSRTSEVSQPNVPSIQGALFPGGPDLPTGVFRPGGP